MIKTTREALIEAAKQVAIKQGSPISRANFTRITGISTHQIYKLFPEGGWNEVKRLSHLQVHKQGISLSNDQLLTEFHKVVIEINDIPTWTIFNSRAEISSDVVRRRFNGIQGTLKFYKKWLIINDPHSSFIKIVDKKLQSKNQEIEPVSSPNLQITSDAVKQALADAEQLIHTQGALSGVDRAHTAFHGYLLAVIRKLNLEVKKDAEVIELFQIIRDNHPDLMQSDSTENEITKIFRGTSKILESINQIRNRGSLAHPNQNLLKEPEAMLVINMIRTLLHYLNSKIKNS